MSQVDGMTSIINWICAAANAALSREDTRNKTQICNCTWCVYPVSQHL